MSVSEILVLIRWFNALWALIHATSYPTLVLFTWLWRSVAPNGPMDTLRQRVWVSFIMNQGNVRIIALWKPSTWEIARKKHRSCGEWVAVVVVAGRGPGRGRPRGRSRGSGRARGGGGCFCCCCCCGGAAAFSWYMNVDETVVHIHAFQYLQFTTIHVQIPWNFIPQLHGGGFLFEEICTTLVNMKSEWPAKVGNFGVKGLDHDYCRHVSCSWILCLMTSVTKRR